MNDDEIINLFLKRDENGIIELSTKYHPIATRLPGIYWRIEKMPRNV